MIREFGGCLIIIAILGMVPRCESAKKDIVDFNQFTISNKSRSIIGLSRKCLFNKRMLLAVNENLEDNLVRYLHRSETTSLTSLARSKLFVQEWYFTALNNKQVYYGHHYYRFLWKSLGFLVAASSPANLKEQLDIMKNSRWWNPVGFFFFIEDDENSTVESCGNAYDFLALAWKYGLLNSVFLCQEADGTSSIYSYNPFSNSAPQPWLKNREIIGRYRHPWSLFKWAKYDGRRYTCEDIFFDKTTSLNGYPISINALKFTPFLYFDESKTGLSRYNGEDGWIMKDIWDFLNASVIEVLQSEQSSVVGWVDENGTFHGNLIDISSGKVDIGLNSMILQPVWKVTTTYPHSSVNICFVTKGHGTIPWLIGLVMIFDKWTTICIFAVFGVSLMIFGYFDKRRYLSGFMNVLRVYVSSSFIRPPSLNGLRLILGSVLLIPVIFNSIIQGNILSLIRNPLNNSNIDALDDLQPSGFHVEGLEVFKTFITNPEMRKSFVAVQDSDDCLLKLYADQPVACMNYCFTLMVKASYQKGLHIAEDQSAHYQNRYIAEPDWSLKHRFNEVLQRIVEAGLTDFYRRRSLYDKVVLSDNNDSSDNDAVVLRLREFRYVFMALGIGWVFATLVFVGELVVGRSKIPEISKTRAKPIATGLRGLKMSRLVRRTKLRFAGLCKD